MSFDLHHVHRFASDMEDAIQWWCRHLDAKVIFDGELAGARNVFLTVGSGRLHIYDQPPKNRDCGRIHHLGIKVADRVRSGGDCRLKVSLRPTAYGNTMTGAM